MIVTNNHVVDSTEQLYVQFIDGETVEAQVKGTDASADLAVVAVKLDTIANSTKQEICIARMGDSDSLKIGEPAIAIGNALGYGQSVTTGVISALNRKIENSNSEEGTSLIQTDAAINPGNSGGALLNMRGEVIGINSNKIGGSSIEGMGYAIPISTARPIIEDLMERQTRTKYSEERARISWNFLHQCDKRFVRELQYAAGNFCGAGLFRNRCGSCRIGARQHCGGV